MSNFLSRLVAKQLSSREGSQAMMQAMIQPRPIARFESVVFPTATPVMPQSEGDEAIDETHSLMYSRHFEVNLQDSSQNHFSQTSIQSHQSHSNPQAEAVIHPLHREPVSDLPVSDLPVSDLPVSDLPVSNLPVSNLPVSNLDTLSSPTPAPPFLGTASSPLRPLLPETGSQVKAGQPTAQFKASRPLRSSSSVEPSLMPALPTEPLPSPMRGLPRSVTPLTASDQRPTFRAAQELLPTSPLLVPPTPPQTLPSEHGAPVSSAVPAPASIQVTIGRIEVRATSPSVAPVVPAPASRPPARMSLEDYLHRRTQGRKP